MLRFSVDDPDIVDRRIPITETGTDVIAFHEETLARGQIPPTAEITWWWSLHDAEGNVTETERRSIRYLDERFEWRTLGDDQVRVWFEGGADAEEAAQQAVESAREAIAWLAEATGRPPDRQVEIVAYGRQEDLRRALAARGDVYETRLRTLGARVAPSVVVLDMSSGGRDLGAVIFHELSHVVLGLHMTQPWADLPAWLDEGFAMYAEGEMGGQEQSALERALAQDELMSVRSLSSFPGDAERVTQAYGQSRDFVAFLIEEHDPALFTDLLDALAPGDASVDDALGAVYGYDRLSMYQAYRAARDLEPAIVPTADAGGASSRQGEAGTLPSDTEPSVPERSPAPMCAGAFLLHGLALGLVFRFRAGGRRSGRKETAIRRRQGRHP